MSGAEAASGDQSLLTSVNDVHLALQTGFEDLKDTLVDASAAKVKRSTLYNVVELAMLRACSLLETFLRDLFYLAMLGQLDLDGVEPILALTSPADIDRVIYRPGAQREKFLDWLPYVFTLERAEAFLAEARPFSRIKYRQVERRALEEVLILRNAVAHPGDYAHDKFVTLASQRNYPSRRPGEYLLSVRSGESEALLLLTRIEVVARGLIAWSDTDANELLEPEELFTSKRTAPAGEYTCAGCGATYSNPVAQPIGPCGACASSSRCATCGRTTSNTPMWRRVYLQPDT